MGLIPYLGGMAESDCVQVDNSVGNTQLRKQLNGGASSLVVAMFLFGGLVASTSKAQADSGAGPTGGQVVSGTATINHSNQTTNINQTSGRAVINWQNFSINAGSTVNFNQPNSSSATLNRVTGSQMSKLMGTLNANGSVYLINPNGVVVGANGVINAKRFVATTRDINSDTFLSGKKLELKGDSEAGLTNLGTINTGDGGAYLVGRHVTNEGTISSTGEVALVASNSKVIIFPQGESGIDGFGIEVDLEDGSAGTKLDQKGTISALKTRLAAVGNDAMLLLAPTSLTVGTGVAMGEDGEVYITSTGRVDMEGRLTSEEITVLGNDIRVAETSHTIADGNDGGDIKIGGAFQGASPEDGGVAFNAETTTVEEGAILTANATGEVGDGGEIILWADDHTDFAGHVEAKGAIGNNDGGFVEVSGKETLAFRGTVDTGGGDLLLDPTNIEIVSGTTGAITGSSPGTSSDSSLGADTLTTALAANNVTISTSASGSEAGDIKVSSDVLWNASTKLTLSAHDDIAIFANVGDSNVSDGNDAQVALYYDTDNDGNGSYNFGLNQDGVSTGFKGSIDLSAGNNFFTKDGTDSEETWTVITSLGDANHNGFANGAGSGDVTLQNLAHSNNLESADRFVLGADIDASATSSWNSSAGFAPIGDNSTRYQGNFDGLGHVVSNLTINRSSTDYQGLFGAGAGKISNVGVTNATVSGKGNVGILVGGTYGNVSNTYSTGSVTGANDATGGANR